MERVLTELEEDTDVNDNDINLLTEDFDVGQFIGAVISSLVSCFCGCFELSRLFKISEKLPQEEINPWFVNFNLQNCLEILGNINS